MENTNQVMTAAMKRRAVKVAQDVLDSTRVLKVKARNGYVVYSTYGPEGLKLRTAVTSQRGSKAQAGVMKKHCEVCALGACLLSVVALENKFQFTAEGDLFVTNKSVYDRLRSVFTPRQLTLIEDAFETRTTNGLAREYAYDNSYVEVEGQHEAQLFGMKYPTDKLRLRAIMKNIIKNGGEFIPPALPKGDS